MPRNRSLYVAHGARESPQKERKMKVAELIEILEDMDPDAEVLIGSQENWPFERRFRIGGRA